MTRAQVIHICGDVHGNWDLFNNFIDTHIRRNEHIDHLIETYGEVEVIILQVGDFGYWPNVEKYKCTINNRIEHIKDGYAKIYWIDGNHENHDALDKLEEEHPDDKFIEILPQVFYATFGSVLALNNEAINVMFCGGADSIDKRARIAGDSWFPQEVITMKDMYKLPEPNSVKIDWVISHTNPSYFNLGSPFNSNQYPDPSRDNLNWVFDNFRPSRWWFGHYHTYLYGKHHDCRWTGLNKLDKTAEFEWTEWKDTLMYTHSDAEPFYGATLTGHKLSEPMHTKRIP